MAGAHGENAAVEPVAILDRPEARGFWNVAWPLSMLAIIAAIIVQSCMPERVAPPKFDANAATRAANEKALAALTALTVAGPDAGLIDVVPLLNLMVINFASGSAAVPGDAAPVLKQAAQVIAALPEKSEIFIVGHTDNVGAAENNAALSLQRAEAVRAALVANGVAQARLKVAGAGDSRPIAANATEQGRFANRRIEFSDSAL